MKQYFLSVILVSVFGGTLEELLPEGSAVRPHMRLVTGLSVLLVLILPVKGFLVSAGDFLGALDLSAILSAEEREEEYGELFSGILSDYARGEAERLLAEELSERFGMRAGTCRAVILAEEDGSIARVTVLVSGTSVLVSPYEIEEYVNGRFACPCDVVVD